MNNKTVYISICFVIMALTALGFAQDTEPIKVKKQRIQRMQELKKRIPSRLGPEQEQEALEFLQSIDPEAAGKLETLKDEHHNIYRKRISQIYRDMKKYKAIKNQNPERAERLLEIKQLESKAQQLGEQYKQADEQEQSQIKSDLNQVLKRLFDLRLQEKYTEVEKLEERLENLKADLEERKEHKSDIVERRLEELTMGEHLTRWK